MEELIALSARVVVMTERGQQMLQDVYALRRPRST